METRKRSFVKSLSWRVIGLILTFVTAWLVTGSWRTGLAVGFVDFLVKIGTFYAHERVWHRVSWGLIRPEQVYNGEGI